MSASGYDSRDIARCWAGFASLGAGLIHLAVVREHFAEWWVFGVFFVALGAAQISWALLAWARPRPPVPGATIAVLLGVISLWAVTRTTGLPVGPTAGQAEAVARPDLLAVVLEIGVVLSLLVARRRDAAVPPRPQQSAWRYVALLAAGAFVVSAITTPALAATESGKSSHGHFAGGDD